MIKATEAGNYATYQAESGRWYYHPTDRDWLAFNRNEDFSRHYATEDAALEAAEMQEQMDQEGIDGPFMNANGEILP